MRRRRFLKLGAASLVAQPFVAPAVVRAQSPWPDKPVRIIVPFAAGGGTDALARPWAEALSKAFGQQFVIENRGGASGLIGTEAAAKSPPDGYTLLITGATTTVAIPLMRKVNYDADGLMPIARMGDVACGFVISATVGPKTLSGVLSYAKANPGTRRRIIERLASEPPPVARVRFQGCNDGGRHGFEHLHRRLLAHWQASRGQDRVDPRESR